jgi:hypothetical protein
MKYQKLVAALIVLGLLFALGILTGTCRAAGLANTTTLAAGVSGVWFDGPDAPGPAVEAAGLGAMSLSPHIALVGMLGWGLTDTYLRSTVGVRVTATDVDNPNFSVGLGIQRHDASVTRLGPSEWCPDVAVGLRPYPVRWPAVTLTGLGFYGLESGRAGCSIGARWAFDL